MILNNNKNYNKYIPIRVCRDDDDRNNNYHTTNNNGNNGKTK